MTAPTTYALLAEFADPVALLAAAVILLSSGNVTPGIATSTPTRRIPSRACPRHWASSTIAWP